MNKWDKFYERYGVIDRNVEPIIAEIFPRLKSEGLVEVLDAGCGTGRNSLFLAKRGFNVHGIDISQVAIEIAKSKKGRLFIDYRSYSLVKLPFSPESMDFIFAIHSLEYNTEKGIKKSVEIFSQILKQGKPILLVVDSTEHPFNGIDPKSVHEISHLAYSVKNRITNHFFKESELRNLFKDYYIEKLEHVSIGNVNDQLSPLREWKLWGYKK
jgi:SAM-dependent methyltransferase